jgi:hypothetical protein
MYLWHVRVPYGGGHVRLRLHELDDRSGQLRSVQQGVPARHDLRGGRLRLSSPSRCYDARVPAADPEKVYRDAVREGDLAAIERYLAAGRSATEMLRLTWSGEAVDRLVAAGADVRAGDDPPVVWLAQFGKTDALERMLAAGADPDARRGMMRTTALMMAAYHGKVPAIRVLFAAGADPNAVDWAGNTALHEAVQYKAKSRRRVVQALLAGGADPTSRNQHGETAADIARQYGHADVLALLPSG